MNIIELFENNRANLYHAAYESNSIKIILDNQIMAKTSHTKPNNIDSHWSLNSRSFREKDSVGNSVFGVSLTRSFNFAKNWRKDGFIFELNTNKLIHKYRIIQIDYYMKRIEAEEFLIGSITPLDEYLVNIWTTEKNILDLNQVRNEDPEYCTHMGYDLLLDHPKLKIY